MGSSETDYTKSTAVFSLDEFYRYTLERSWSLYAAKTPVNFVLLNPSTATATEDDPTIRRCVGFADAWGFDTMIVTNLFALRSTDPKQLKQVTDPIGPENDKYLLEAARKASLVVCAWGNGGHWKDRGMWVEAMLRQAGVKLHCLGKTHAYRTKKEPPQPRHPLYLRRNEKPEIFI